jgi:hypothetical protein
MSTGSRALFILIALAAGMDCAAVAHVLSVFPGRPSPATACEVRAVTRQAGVAAVLRSQLHPFARFDFAPAVVSSVMAYDADGRCSASLADAHERRLLFVKTTLG